MYFNIILFYQENIDNSRFCSTSEKWTYMAIFEQQRNSFRTHEGFVEVSE